MNQESIISRIEYMIKTHIHKFPIPEAIDELRKVDG